MSILSAAIAAFSSTPSWPSEASPDNVTRHNEHLAVLLPKYLWKSDHLASHCDTFGCPIKFSILERRHHCRKCGGIFCSACSSRATRLLDTSSLDFFHPPKGVLISDYNSPASPVVECRVCDDCWDQIHGLSRSSHSSNSSESSSLCSQSTTPSVCSRPFSSSSSAESSLCSSIVTTPPNGQVLNLVSPSKTQSLHTISSASSIDGSVGAGRPKRMSIRHSRLPLHAALPSERSYGELDAYPLRRSSVLCKVTGGGRWEPKQSPVHAGYRPPILGGKALFEIEMENEEREQQLRRANPMVEDGDFKYRFPKDPEPVILSRSPYHLATF